MTSLNTLKIALILAFSAMAGTAFAHAHLEYSSPADGASLHMAPKAIEMEFDDPVVLTKLDIKGDKGMVPLDFKRGEASTKASVALPELAMGAYTVSWSALSTEDSHPLKGTFSFTVAAH